MHTKDFLAEALRHAKLDEMAGLAATGYFDDYLSPLATPQTELLERLAKVEQTPAVIALRARVLDGDFDATTEEAIAWGKSQDGQETFAKLVPGKV